MPQYNDLKKRINAIREIRKMTKATGLISAVRMRDAREQEAATLPFSTHCALAIAEIFKRSPDLIRKLLNFGDFDKNEPYPIKLYLLTGDKGLSGDFNDEIVKLAERLAGARLKTLKEEGYQDVRIECKFCGKMGPDLLRSPELKVNRDFRFSIDHPSYYQSMDLAELVYREAKAREAAEIYFVYCRLDTAITVEPGYTRIFPLDEEGMHWLSQSRAEREAARKAKGEQRRRFDRDFSKATGISARRNDYEERSIGAHGDDLLLPFAFAGDEDKVISYLVGTYLDALVYGLLTESYASEQLSRMTSMDAATTNADSLLEELIRERNRFRQKEITTEITEIVGGAEAIRKGEQ